MTPLVSILVPAYNCERWIKDALKSALDQTYSRTEIIVVDDGSTDGTFSIASALAGPKLKVIKQENQGASDARNKALSISQGDYIQWLDADDLLASDKISRQMALVRELKLEPTVLLSSPWGRFSGGSQKLSAKPGPLWADLSPLEWLTLKLEHAAYMTIESWLTARQLCTAAGPWDTSLSADDDGEYFCRVLLKSTGIRFVPGAWSYYRATAGNSQSVALHSPEKVASQFRSLRLHLEYLRSLEDSPRTRTACLSFLQASFIVFYPEWPRWVEECHALAAALGGELHEPKLSLKCSVLKRAFGWRIAKQAYFLGPGLKALFQAFRPVRQR